MRAACLLVAIVVFAVGSSVRAQDRPRVAVQSPPALARTSTRIRAELATRGFEPIAIEPPVPVTREALERLAAELDAIAILSLEPNDQGVELWAVDRLTGKTVLRQVDGASDEDILAHRAVETLRASLLELQITEEPIAVPEAVQAMVSLPEGETTPRLPPWFWLRLGPCTSVTFGGLDPTWGVGVHGDAYVMPELALGAHLQIPTFPVGLAREDGRADVLFASFGVEVSWHPLRRPVDLWAAGRGGAQWVWASGSADAGRSGRVVDAWAARIDLEVGAAVELDRVLALYGSVSGGVVVPEIAIAFGDAVVARWGLPVVEISLGLRIGLGL